MLLRHSNDDDLSLYEGDISGTVESFKRGNRSKIRTILNLLADFDQNYLSWIGKALKCFPEESPVHWVVKKYVLHRKRWLAQSFTVNWWVILTDQNVLWWPHYFIKYCTQDEWGLIVKSSVKGTTWKCLYFEDHFPIICIPSSWVSSEVLDHEIRHARDHYIIAEQSAKDQEIAMEIIAYLTSKKWTKEIREKLIDAKSNPYDVSEEDRIFITLVCDAIDKLDAVNLDLLSITPLRKWPKILSGSQMERITSGLSSNMKLKMPEMRSVQEWSQKSWLNPRDMPTESFIFEDTTIWGDIWRFPNITTLTFLSPDIKGDISKIFKKMKNLRIVILQRRVYENISKAFLEKTPISFIILDE